MPERPLRVRARIFSFLKSMAAFDAGFLVGTCMGGASVAFFMTVPSAAYRVLGG
jgi:hypothetical protein